MSNNLPIYFYHAISFSILFLFTMVNCYKRDVGNKCQIGAFIVIFYLLGLHLYYGSFN